MKLTVLAVLFHYTKSSIAKAKKFKTKDKAFNQNNARLSLHSAMKYTAKKQKNKLIKYINTP
jgi:hypothetical protein